MTPAPNFLENRGTGKENRGGGERERERERERETDGRTDGRTDRQRKGEEINRNRQSSEMLREISITERRRCH